MTVTHISALLAATALSLSMAHAQPMPKPAASEATTETATEAEASTEATAEAKTEADAAETIAAVTGKGEQKEPLTLSPGAATVGVKAGEHRFNLTFEPTAVEGMGLVRSKFLNEGIFQSVLDSLADNIALPRDVAVTFKDCGFDNAYWDPDESTVNMCWELISLYNRGYEEVSGEESAYLRGADQDTVLTGTTAFILMHELGHGLVSLFQLPVTGREEDVVDQFATLAMLSADEPEDTFENRDGRLVLLGAYFFQQLASQPGDLTREIFADEHALGQQRYYDVMCLVLGSDQDAYMPILAPGLFMVAREADENPDNFDDERVTDWLTKTDALNILPYERAVRCGDEYAKYSASWDYLLENFMIPQDDQAEQADQQAAEPQGAENEQASEPAPETQDEEAVQPN
ncbi:DUF4344 domain-containing metallopeptidase [Paracoccus sp. S1E-3]|uniref:DUF4344 domain-containing metallopeptidase n=1 Tax=Paracoccus sp. S1E-3 TaxID=2756130 RepID=UPI0015EF24F9|nr:DUF4344 domain-containing metallopeptidase [Paracoccus sp. S1E-3]MBA4490257.1 hypothetical protein [Paracoccus sp. S1E-3]